jgi:hypothetical protein
VPATPRALRMLVRSRAFALLAGIALTTAIACRDMLSPRQPPTATPTLKPSATPQHDESPNNSPDLTSIDLNMTDIADGTMGTSSPNVGFPFLTVVRVTVKGLEYRTPLVAGLNDPITRGPSGHAVFGWYDLGVYSQVVMGPTTDVLAESVVVYQALKGSIVMAARSGYGKRVYDGQTFNGVRVWCGQDAAHLCDSWTGSTNFRFVRLNAGLTLTVDSTIANSGSAVTFKLHSVPDTVEGQQIPVVVDTASWVPDPDSLGGDYTEFAKTSACNFSGYPRTCQRTLDGPGTLNVVAYSNGKRFALSQHIATRDARPIVVPSKYYARHPGDTVNFTVHMSDGSNFTMWNWIWYADTTPSQTHTTCASYANPCLNTRVFERGHIQATVSHNGRLKKNAADIKVGPPPRLQLGAQPSIVPHDVPAMFATSAGDAPYTISSWTYRLSNGTTGGTSCAAPNKNCTSTLPGSGTMTVVGAVDGSPDSASAPVTLYTSFTLTADRHLVLFHEKVVFTPKYDGSPGPAYKWVFIPDTSAGDHTACGNGVQDCVKAMEWSGTMWAFTASSGGDSASQHVSLVDLVDTSGLGGSCPQGTRSRRPSAWMGNSSTQNVVDTCGPDSTGANVTCPTALYPRQIDSLKQQYIYTNADHVPTCDDFRYRPSTTHFGWPVIQSHDSGTITNPKFDYAVFAPVLESQMELLYSDTAYTVTTPGNRVYSTPIHNQAVPNGKKKNSQHVYGTAVDIQTKMSPPSSPTTASDTLNWLGLRAHAKLRSPTPCAEPISLDDHHLHIDFRTDPSTIQHGPCPASFVIP